MFEINIKDTRMMSVDAPLVSKLFMAVGKGVQFLKKAQALQKKNKKKTMFKIH